MWEKEINDELDCEHTGDIDLSGIWYYLCGRFFKKKAFSIFYCCDSGSNFSGTGGDVFVVSGGKLVWSDDVDVIGICVDDTLTVGKCKNDDGGRILLCSMGILYLVPCLRTQYGILLAAAKRWEIPAEVFPIVLLLVGTAGVIACRYTVAIWIPEDKRFLIGPRQLTSALVLLAMQGYLFCGL